MLVVMAILVSCQKELVFEDNQRIGFEALLMNSAQEPLSNVSLEVFAATETELRFDEAVRGIYGTKIAEGRSDGEGKIRILTFNPINANNILASINFKPSGNTVSYARTMVNFVNGLSFADNTYNLGTVVLDTIVPFDLRVSRQRNSTDTLNLSVESNRSRIKLLDNDPVDNPFFNPNRDFSFFSLAPGTEDRQIRVTTIESDTILLNYQLFNNGVTEQGELKINVAETNGTYEFIF
ncbi:hypothetical protein [Croceitalea dokdonensis]|nr:hypothetical protein [Croceitalea dokdonensis]